MINELQEPGEDKKPDNQVITIIVCNSSSISKLMYDVTEAQKD